MGIFNLWFMDEDTCSRPHRASKRGSFNCLKKPYYVLLKTLYISISCHHKQLSVLVQECLKQVSKRSRAKSAFGWKKLYGEPVYLHPPQKTTCRQRNLLIIFWSLNRKRIGLNIRYHVLFKDLGFWSCCARRWKQGLYYK